MVIRATRLKEKHRSGRTGRYKNLKARITFQAFFLFEISQL